MTHHVGNSSQKYAPQKPNTKKTHNKPHSENMKPSLTTSLTLALATIIPSNAEIFMVGELSTQDKHDCVGFHSVNFEKMDDNDPLPWTVYDDILSIGKISFAERFQGQELDETVTKYDKLIGNPTNPLTLQLGNKGQNLAVYYNHFNNGSALNGLGPRYTTATGSISGVIDETLSWVDVEIMAGEPFKGRLFVQGFRRDGSLINKFTIRSDDFLWDDGYGFVRLGMVDMAGFSIDSVNTGRIYLDNVNMCDPTQPNLTVPPTVIDSGDTMDMESTWYPTVSPVSQESLNQTEYPSFEGSSIGSNDFTASNFPSISLSPTASGEPTNLRTSVPTDP